MDLCVSKDGVTKSSDLYKTDNNRNEERCPYLPNGKDYNLFIIQT